jgi:hypothetical protein
LQLFDRFPELLILRAHFPHPPLDAGWRLLPSFWRDRTVAWRHEIVGHAAYSTPFRWLFSTPLNAYGQRFVQVTDRRTKVDWAYAVRDLVDIHYPEAEPITLIMDNLNPHSLGVLYEAFEPAEAKRIADRLDSHYTPKHGSWLNMAEIELSVLARQCLDRRIPDAALLKRSVAAWQTRRNQAQVKVDWRFTSADARIKLKRLYPSIQVS